MVYTSSATVVIGADEELLEGVDESKPYPDKHMDAYTDTKVSAYRLYNNDQPSYQN